MNKFLPALMLALLACQSVVAAEGPSEASVRELLAVMDSRKVIENTLGQVDAMMQASIKDALQGKTLTSDQERILADMRARMLALLNDAMQWEVLEPMFLDVYEKSFSQKEVDGMIKFYKSETGRAVIAKLPAVLQHTMGLMQNRMAAMMPQLQQIQRETVAQLTATEQK
jgi:hypothetical protein